MEIANVKMWVGDMEVEQPALDQIFNISQLPVLAGHIAIMPDVHMGKGATVDQVWHYELHDGAWKLNGIETV